MKKIYFSLLVACLSLLATGAIAQTTTYSSAGSFTYVVPAGYSAVTIDMAGAQGGTSGGGAPGGKGGRVQAILSVSGGQTLYVNVGGQGASQSYCSSRPGGTNGGGNGYGYGGGGGGMTDIRINSGAFAFGNEFLVAAGGGGAGYNYGNNQEKGGDGGGLVGEAGWEGSPAGPTTSYGGSPGTQTGPGAGGTYTTSYAGSAGQGGNSLGATCYAGGGGGGYYGGGTGNYGGGGGGSSFLGGPGVVTSSTTMGYQSGTGFCSITPLPPTVTSSPTSLAFGGVTVSTTSATMLAALSSVALTGTALTVTPPANFQVSPDGVTWYTNSSPYSLTYSGSSFSGLFLYVQFLPTAIAAYSGNIAITGGGLSAAYNIAVTGTGSNPCSGTPTAGTATINGGSSASGNSSTAFTLNVPGATVGGGITYQWQVSTTSSTTGFSNIGGAITGSFVYSGLSANSWFRCIVSCGASSATSGTCSATFTLPGSGCTPAFTYNCGSYPMSTSINSLVGFSGTISDPSACGPNYVDNSGSMSCTLLSGTTYNVTVGVSTSYYSSFAVQMWIDFNDNGSFETSEIVGGAAQGGFSSSTGIKTITIPAGAAAGAHRLRIVGIYCPTCYGFPNYPTIPPCPTTSIYYGNARDYKVIIPPPSPVLTATTVSPFANTTVGTNSVPVGFSQLTGSSLTPSVGLITVNAPANYLVSSTGTTWSSSAILGYAGGALPPTNVYFQFNPTAATSYSANATANGGSISSAVNIALTGTGTNTPCTGSPTAGTASVSPTSGSSTTNFVLSLSGASANGGQIYQWQSSPDGTTWTNIAPAITPTYSFTGVGANTQFRCMVGCVSNGVTTTSNSGAATATYAPAAMAASSCTPSYNYTCSSYPMSCSINSLIGVSGAISDPGACGANYVDNTGSMSVTLNSGGTYSLTYGLSTTYYCSFAAQVWIDFNNNGTFEATESVGGFSQGTYCTPTPIGTITLPSGLASGNYRMRIVGLYCPTCYGFPNYPSIPPCPTTSIYYGNTRDYKVVINGGAGPCTGQPIGGTVSGVPLASCSSFNANLFTVGEAAGGGVSYQWQSSTSPTSGFTNIAGATNAYYAPLIGSVGTFYYRDSIRCSTSGLSSKSTVQAVTLNASPSPIAGASSVCAGSTATMTSTPLGGTWTSSNPAAATIGSTTGVLTGVAAGVTNLTYTLSTGCITVLTVTVNPQPGAISGANTVCGGLSTTLSCSPGGGTWASSNISLATIGSSTGVVTGMPGVSGSLAISYTLPTGCSSFFPMTVNLLSPITGTPSMCMGYTTTLSDATPGGTWSTSNPAVATVSGGVVTSVSVGTTTISYNIASTGCTATVLTAVTNPPSTFGMTGGGSYCSGGTGGVVVGLNGSNAGISYTLFAGTTPVATAIGAGFAFNFPAVFGAGIYGVVAASGTPCATTMSGTSTVVINPLPTQYTVSASGGGTFCTGGSGVHIFLSGSQIGVNYQLFNGTVPVGAPIPGSSAALDFGLVTGSGTYSVSALNTTTLCTGNMANTVSVSANPLPSAFTVSPATGGYCVGGTGVPVSLGNSTVGVNYQLLIAGVPTGSVVAGTGGALSFGLQTIGGSYTVLATNATTGCQSTMTGSSVLSVNPLPSLFSVTGGGSVCPGGLGADVQLNGSQSGVSYQLFRGGLVVTGASMSGTGSLLDFGLQSTPGSYTIVATNPTTTCTSNMSSSANVAINPAPVPVAVVVVGGGSASYCAGGTGVHVGLAGSTSGVNYSLYNGVTLVGALSGTGSPLDFGAQTSAGTYTATAMIVGTGCTGAMAGSVNVIINPLPTAFTVTVAGGGVYCAGGSGQVIGLSGSQLGVNYTLYRSGVAVGAAMAGTGSAISFPAQTIAGSYTVVATNPVTLCSNNMTGSASIIINPAPVVYNVSGGGNYCATTTGVHIGLTSSDIGINYQLVSGGPVGAPMPGVGGSLDFGVFTTAGTYTIVATNSTTSCTSTMAGSAVVAINPLPPVNLITATGATSFCAGATGTIIGVNGSALGVNYTLFNGTTPVGTALAGTGSAISFGAQSAGGTYTAKATNASTGCVSNMTGSVTLTVQPLPTAFSVTGGGGFCSGGSGMHINLSGSQTGKKYQLYSTSGPVAGALRTGTGFALDFGLMTVPSTYTVVATDTTTLCSNNMTGSVVLSINPLPTPFLIGGGGTYCAGSAGPHINLSNSATGITYQLFTGTTLAGPPMSGTGSPLDFGPQTTAGTYTIVATNTATGCTSNMTGTTIVAINALPSAFNVTGGGNYCPAGTGVHIGLSGSLSGTVYQLYRGSSTVGTALAGSGAALDFGLQTGTGTYTVVATNLSTGCTGAMTGSVSVGVNSLPVVYNVTGTGNYCPGGAGSHVGLSGSATGVNYQLFRSGVLVGASFTGTGSALDFGLQTTGNYTVVATSTSTTCTNNMNGSAVIGVSPLPTLHTVTGGGNFCTGGTGVHVGLDGSDVSTWYQLYRGTAMVGTAMAGTGSSIDFGLQTGAGVYTIMSTSTTTTCASGMTGSVTVGTVALPTAFAVTGGGNYCSGGTGADVMLSGSATGFNYQLFNGSTPVGTPMAGTGSALDFGMQMASGNYTVVATDGASTCTNNMTGIANVGINPLPTMYNVMGGGNFCTGSAGVHVTLSGSDVGTSYQLFNGGVAVSGPMPGTGLTLDFGLVSTAGTYTVKATNTTTTCTGNMNGSVAVAASPLPTGYVVAGSGTTYCAGGTGIDITLSGSDIGTNYQLYNGLTPVGGAMAGTSAALDFGYHTATGTYTVVAVNTATTCTGNMIGSASIAIGTLPVAYTVTGGGNFCDGGTGVHVGLSGSNVTVLYQLYRGTTPVGGTMAGTGLSLDFGLQTTAGTYSVVASNPGSTCNNNMAGTAVITTNSLPVAFSVTGGGGYCASGNGVHVNLTGSAVGVTYQLYKSGTASGAPLAGTGAALDFGLKTAAGTYTVVATNSTTGCSNTMSSSVPVVVNPQPSAFAVTGGGNFCPGGTGVHVGLANSVTGINYQLYKGTTLVGAAVAGTGSNIDFGLQTSAGTYAIVATNTATGCTGSMSGNANVVVNAVPNAYNVMGGGSYCSGMGGVHMSLSGSDAGMSYQAYNGFAAVGSPVIGTGAPLDLGMETIAGTYSVIATDPSTSCSNNMAGTSNVAVIASVIPAVSISNTGGDTLCSGIVTNFTAVPVNGGTSASYQWTINGVVVGTGSHYSYIPVNGDVIGATMTSSAQCASPAVVNNTRGLTVNTELTPAVAIAANPGTEVCQGTAVSYTASPTGGGSAPTYSWIKNGVTVGSTANYSYSPANGDVIYCVLSSNYHCRTANTASSNQLTMTVDVAAAPIVSISVQPNGHIAPGQAVTFTATSGNAGPSPTYQWFVNGVPVPGATMPVYVGSNFSDQDIVSCEVTSSGGCAGIVGSASSVVHMSGVGVKPVVFAGSDIRLIPNPNNGNFTLKGTLGSTAAEELTLEVTDMIGQTVYTGKITVHNGELNETIRLSNLANGMYLLNLRSESDNKVFHMIIEQ